MYLFYEIKKYLIIYKKVYLGKKSIKKLIFLLNFSLIVFDEKVLTIQTLLI